MTRAKAEPSAEPVPASGAFGEIELELGSDPAIVVEDDDDDEPTSRRRPVRAEELPPSRPNEAPTRIHLEDGPAARAAALAAIRELYAGGETAAALALASEVEVDAASGAPAHPSEDMGTAIASASDRSSYLPSFLSQETLPRLLLGPEDIARLDLDHRAGFLLAHVDGKQSTLEILDVCAMPEAEALAILERLCTLGVIAW